MLGNVAKKMIILSGFLAEKFNGSASQATTSDYGSKQHRLTRPISANQGNEFAGFNAEINVAPERPLCKRERRTLYLKQRQLVNRLLNEIDVVSHPVKVVPLWIGNHFAEANYGDFLGYGKLLQLLGNRINYLFI